MKVSEFLSENFQCLVVKISIYSNGRVFVMCRRTAKALKGWRIHCFDMPRKYRIGILTEVQRKNGPYVIGNEGPDQSMYSLSLTMPLFVHNQNYWVQ